MTCVFSRSAADDQSDAFIYSAILTVTEEANNKKTKQNKKGLKYQYTTVSAHHNMCAQFQHFNWFIPGNSIMTTEMWLFVS